MWKSLTKVYNQKILLSFNFWRFAITFLKSLFVEIMLGVFFLFNFRNWIQIRLEPYLDPVLHSNVSGSETFGAEFFGISRCQNLFLQPLKSL